MQYEELKQLINQQLADTTGCNKSEIFPEKNIYSDLGIEDLDISKVILALEKRFAQPAFELSHSDKLAITGKLVKVKHIYEAVAKELLIEIS